MKKILPILLLSLFSLQLFGQTVENIRVEQDGDKLNIHYRIGGSTNEQLYFVTLTCSIDGKPEFEPQTVLGDVGANIRGGKPYNTIVWDVFKDVEEIGSVEFFVKVDLTSDEAVKSPVVTEKKEEAVKELTTNKQVYTPEKPMIGPNNTFFIAYAAGLSHFTGLSFGITNNWGFYTTFRYGGYQTYTNIFNGLTYSGTVMSLDAGITKRFRQKGTNRQYVYLGGGAGSFGMAYPELDMGVMFIINNRFHLSVGLSTAHPDLTMGVGLQL